MPFSTSFCLTNTGNLPSTTTLSFYTNVNGYAEPPFLSQVLLADVSGSNCPHIINGVPDGTTQIKVQTSTGNCCEVIDISPNNPCSFCDIGFDFFLTNTISQIVAGNLTGSCDSVISDYRIEWYEITNPNSPVYKFTTGPAGTLYGSIQHTHPLVGITSVPVPNGIYKPVLTRVNINGINYSSTSGPGFVQSDLNNCFSNVTVNSAPLTCANGPELGDYSHIVNFSGASEGTSPPPLTMVYQLGPNTKYLAWKFNAFDIPDNIKISYVGSYYNNQPIVLEFSDAGFNIPSSNYSLTINPKLIRTFGPIKKVTNLSNIIRSSGDYLLIQITPNPTNLRTNFESAFQCLDTFDCSSCWDTYNTQPQKIISGSVSSSADTCNIVSIKFKVSGCSISSVQDTDFYKYMGGSMPESPGYGGINDIYLTQKDYSTSLWHSNTNCSLNGQGVQSFCPTITGNGTIIFTKNQTGVGGIGNILIKCSLIEDFNAYYQSYLTRMSELSSYSSNPTNINYYKYFVLKQPLLTSNSNESLDVPCGDGQPIREYYIHPSSVVTTGFTSGYYTMNLTMPTITKQIFYTNCQLNCDSSVQTVVSIINTSSLTGPQMNTTNNKSNRYTVPFYTRSSVSLSQNSRTSWTFTNRWFIPKFFAETIPYSGSPLVIIPSLSASTCTRLPIIQFCPGDNPQQNRGAYVGYTMYYQVRLTNPLNPLDFEILTTPIVNGGWPGISFILDCQYINDPTNLIVVYQVVNGQVTISNPNYFVNAPSAYTIYKRYNNI
jgi:hypothetical protein